MGIWVSKFKPYAKVFGLLLGLSVSLISAWSLVKVDEKNDQLIFFILATLALLILAVVIVKIQKLQEKRNSTLNHIKQDIRRQGHKINLNVNGIDSNKDLLKLQTILGRYISERNKYKQIADGEWKVRVLEREEYFVYTFRQVLSTLRTGDVYQSITSLQFWERDIPDRLLEEKDQDLPAEERISFITANILAIKDRGVIIKRYFLVSKAEIQKEANQEKTPHRVKLEAVINNLKDAASYNNLRSINGLDEFFEKHECVFKFILTDFSSTETRKNSVYATISNETKQSFMTLESVEGNATYVNMKFYRTKSHNHYSEVMNKIEAFKAIDNKCFLSIEGMAKLLGIS